jgi:hypothetical protein
LIPQLQFSLSELLCSAVAKKCSSSCLLASALIFLYGQNSAKVQIHIGLFEMKKRSPIETNLCFLLLQKSLYSFHGLCG